MDNSQSQHQKRWNLIPLSPAQTPRSSQKAMRDSLSLSADSNLGDKGVNVQVILRCRPLNEDEMRVKSPVVISCNEHRRVVSVIQNTAYKQIDKTFAFDKVFGPTSQQKEVFDLVVSPIVNEMLEGYNCTIFAYGQTGTGKTYTMEGGRVGKNGEFPNDAGVIPRAVQEIFDVLEAKNAEYSMRVTFLELYNEEIMDLLAPDESLDDKPKKPITLMEDGKGCVYVRGLEQEVVCTANEIYKILEKGSARRRTGETLLNKQSSRSHTIFSITVHMKESVPEGQELIKCGKLNLVDLSGSENILRSGAREGRAREAGEINKSLLTLGRVINALVEHSGHVPYRDSKLTRLLRDSLGGKTKTCIIATISPSIHSLEETINTLDYAHRAKNIKNKPEVNQRMIKSEFIKDLCAEIDVLRQELYSAREKNGIYIPQERYLNEEAEKKAMAEKIERMELKEFKEKKLMELEELYNNQQLLTAELSEKLDRTKKELEQTQHTLFDLEDRYRKAKATIKEKEYLVSNLLRSEKELMEQALELRTELENAGSEVSSLFTKIECKDKLADGNKILIQNFQTLLAKQLEVLHEIVAASVTQQEQQLKVMEEDMQSFVSRKARATKELLAQFTKLKDIYGSGFKSLDDLAEKIDRNSQIAFRNLSSEVSADSSSLVDLFKEMSLEADAILDDLQSNLSSQEEKLAAYAKEQCESHTRTHQMTKYISASIMNFFETLSTHTLNLTQLMEDAQAINKEKSYELEKKLEECAAIEKRQLLEKVAELLESSNARKKRLVQTAVEDLFESTASGTCKLQQEMSNMQDFASSVQDKWTAFMGETGTCYLNDKAAMESGKDGLEEGFRNCMTMARMSATQWRITQEAMLAQQKRNIDSVNSFIKDGVETNHMICTKFSSAALSALEEADAANKSILYSVENSLQCAHDAHKNIYLITSTCSEDMNEMKSTHYHNILEIKENAGKHLVDEYGVDEPGLFDT